MLIEITIFISKFNHRSYRLHVATQEGSKGAPLNEALPAIELAKIIYKRRKLKEDAKEVSCGFVFKSVDSSGV